MLKHYIHVGAIFAFLAISLPASAASANCYKYQLEGERCSQCLKAISAQIGKLPGVISSTVLSQEMAYQIKVKPGKKETIKKIENLLKSSRYSKYKITGC